MSTVRPQRGRPSPITLPAGRPEGADAFCSPLARAARCNLRGNANRIGHSVAAAYSQTSPGDPPPRGSLRGNDVPPQLTRDPRGTSAQPKNKTHQNFISNVRWKWDGSGGLPPARGSRGTRSPPRRGAGLPKAGPRSEEGELAALGQAGEGTCVAETVDDRFRYLGARLQIVDRYVRAAGLPRFRKGRGRRVPDSR